MVQTSNSEHKISTTINPGSNQYTRHYITKEQNLLHKTNACFDNICVRKICTICHVHSDAEQIKE